MSRYRLHNRLGSGGFVVQATLATAGIDFDYEPLASVPDEPLGPTVRELNAWGQVPVLELPDDTRLSEVAAILAHLSYAEPALRDGPNLWIDNHPLFLRWSVFLAVNVYEGILRQSYATRYFSSLVDTATDLPDDIDERVATSVRQAATTRIHAAFRCLEEETSGHHYLLGDRLSACDIFLAMLYAWHNQQPDLPRCTRITTAVATHPVIRPIWKQNFHDRLDFRWHEL